MSYIKLDRKLLNWQWADTPEMLALWIHILLNANYQDSKWHGETYEKGSFPTSIGKLAKNTGLSVKQVRTCLDRLEKSGEIGTQRANKGTKITVINWAFYQGSEIDDNEIGQTKGKQRANKGQHLKKYKKERNIRNNIYTPFEEVENEQVKKALLDFREMRKKIKSPMTNYAEKLLLNELNKLASTPNEAIAIINQSILNNWKGIYQLKVKDIKPDTTEIIPVYDNSQNPQFSEERKQRLKRRRNENKRNS